MKKQTAIEWLVEQLFSDNVIFGVSKELFEQAKEMEKKQQGYSEEDMKEAFEAGYDRNTLESLEIPDSEQDYRNFKEWFKQFKKK